MEDGAESLVNDTSGNEVILHGVGGKAIKAQTANQRKMVSAMSKNDLLFAIGPAGTGKTYTAVALAVQALKNKKVKGLNMFLGATAYTELCAANALFKIAMP